MTCLLLDAYVIPGHRIARHRVKSAFHDDAEAIAVACLNIPGHGITRNGNAGGYIHIHDVGWRQYTSPVNRNTGDIP